MPSVAAVRGVEGKPLPLAGCQCPGRLRSPLTSVGPLTAQLQVWPSQARPRQSTPGNGGHRGVPEVPQGHALLSDGTIPSHSWVARGLWSGHLTWTGSPVPWLCHCFASACSERLPVLLGQAARTWRVREVPLPPVLGPLASQAGPGSPDLGLRGSGLLVGSVHDVT